MSPNPMMYDLCMLKLCVYYQNNLLHYSYTFVFSLSVFWQPELGALPGHKIFCSILNSMLIKINFVK